MPCIHDDESFFRRLKQIILDVVSEVVAAHFQSRPPIYAQDQLLTEKQVSQLIGCSVRTLQSWRKQPGKGPCPTMIGSLARYRYSNVIKFIEQAGQ